MSDDNEEFWKGLRAIHESRQAHYEWDMNRFKTYLKLEGTHAMTHIHYPGKQVLEDSPTFKKGARYGYAKCIHDLASLDAQFKLEEGGELPKTVEELTAFAHRLQQDFISALDANLRPTLVTQ